MDDEGRLRWRHGRGRQPADSLAGTVRPDGYIQVCLDGKMYRAHRIIWEILVGPIPVGMEIDHKDGDPSNNRIENLRLATPSQNTVNRLTMSNNTSGHKGVAWSVRKNKWIAYINIDSKREYLGYHEYLDDAVAARKAAEKRLHGEFAR